MDFNFNFDNFSFDVIEDRDDNRSEPEREYILEQPRRRSMNDDDRDDFVAIDFETMSPLQTSACAIGMVKVIDGEIVKQFYSLINPVRDEYTDKQLNRSIHGIDLATAEKADTFEEIFDEVRSFIGTWPLVCHNSGTDIGILKRLMEFYGLSGINTERVIDTYALTGKSLSDCCKQYGIKEDNHHNALWDAETCARIYLELIGKPLISTAGSSPWGASKDSKRKIDSSRLKRLDDDQVENKDSIFYKSTVVITGVFEHFPDRDALAAKLQSLGAKVSSSISKKTTHVLVGQGCGPKKLEKIRELQDAGVDIVILREHQFAEILG